MVWHARVDWTSSEPITESLMLAMMDELVDLAPSGSLARDLYAGSFMVAVEAEAFDDALEMALSSGRKVLYKHCASAVVAGLGLPRADALEEELSCPLFPEVAGWAEIAEMAGVSQQRARQFRKTAGSATPVIVTAEGPLMAKAAVEKWVKHRNTRPGRRPGQASKTAHV